jgi:hypothetical protein
MNFITMDEIEESETTLISKASVKRRQSDGSKK